ncbi:rnhA operon protein [Halomarina halobia]|uniref:RnhA operon protein n=1 Tax=Halomarina halobia TaxID=3033386 RepID=A0ABD6ABP1_9EURY|nr:rnhA operon protein [Halomarina sp. PSR21]
MTGVPDDAVEEATRLTRLARDAVDEREAEAARARRDDLLAEHGFTARVREEDATLVLYPAEWVEDGTVRFDRIDDTDRAIERPLEGPGDGTDWEAVEAHNRAVVARVAAEHGEVHGKNAAAFADFMGNHYAKPIEAATARTRTEFLAEYFPRNAWPDERQREVVEESVDLTIKTAREF